MTGHETLFRPSRPLRGGSGSLSLGPSGARASLWSLAAAFSLMLASGRPAAAAEPNDSRDGAGLHRLAFAEQEIAEMWAQRPPRSEAHRSYIYIDEEDIVEGYELPVFRIEALRSGTRRSLQTMVDGDPAAERRLADLAPALARETEVHAREEAVFFAERPGVARDVPSTPDVVGPFRSWLRQRR